MFSLFLSLPPVVSVLVTFCESLASDSCCLSGYISVVDVWTADYGVCFTVDVSLCKGACRPCLVDVVPVKNEEGVVIMFILDFQELIDRSLKNSGLRQRVAQGWIYCNAYNICLIPCPHDSHSSLWKLN